MKILQILPQVVLDVPNKELNMTTIKNQINSFTSEITRDQVTKFFVFIGGISAGTQIIDDTDISLVSRITKNETCTVVPRVNWLYGLEYTPYTLANYGFSSYVFNPENGMVYLCVGKNQSQGLVGDQAYPSTIPPTHVNGVQTLNDGYSWLALYLIDTENSKFLNSSVLPINSLYDYRTDNLAGTYLDTYMALCNGEDPGITGSCYFYYNEDTYDPITETKFEKGSQVLGIPTSNWYCSVCHEVGEKLGYKSYHVDYLNQTSEITRNPLDEISEIVSSGVISPNSKDYIQQQNYTYVNDLKHAIFNIHLDVSNLTIEQRIVPTQSPTITILDARGHSATARLRTYYDIGRNAFVANGVELLTQGQDFINPSFRIDGGSSSLNKALVATVIDPMFMPDPSVILPTPRVSVIKSFSKDKLTNGFQTNQTQFSKIGVVSNVLKINGSDVYDATNGLIPSETADYRATSILVLQSTGYAGPVEPNVTTGDVSINDTSADTITIRTDTDLNNTSDDYTSKIVSLVQDESSNYLLEISAVDELTFDVFSPKDKVIIDDVEYTIIDTLLPEVKINDVEYVISKSLTTPIDISSTSRQTSFNVNFLI